MERGKGLRDEAVGSCGAWLRLEVDPLLPARGARGDAAVRRGGLLGRVEQRLGGCHGCDGGRLRAEGVVEEVEHVVGVFVAAVFEVFRGCWGTDGKGLELGSG